MIYFILAPELKVVKIGKTNHVRNRLNTLVTGCPTELEVFGVVKEHDYADDISFETYLHRKYDNKWKIREWFYYDEELLEELSAIPNFIPGNEVYVYGLQAPKKVRAKPKTKTSKLTGPLTKEKVLEIDRLIDSNSTMTNAEIAMMAEVSTTAVYRIKCGLVWTHVTGRKNIREYQRPSQHSFVVNITPDEVGFM